MSQLILQKITEPDTPLTNKVTIYAKEDGLVYSKNDEGIETLLSNSDILLLEHINSANPHVQYLLKSHSNLVEYFTIGPTELTNKKIILSNTPAVAQNVQVDVKEGGGFLQYGVDFIVVNNEIRWSGLDFESIAGIDDKLRIGYNKLNTDPFVPGSEFLLEDHVSAPNPHNQYVLKTNSRKIQYFTINPTNIINKKIILDNVPTNPQYVQVDIKEGGGPLFFGEDFIIEGNELKWEGFAYDFVVDPDDILRIIYDHN